MSKKASTAPSAFGSSTLDSTFLANQRPVNTEELLQILELHCAPKVDGEHDPWDVSCTTSHALLIVGEKGIGKSSVVANFARQAGMDMRRIPMGDSNDLDSTGVLEFGRDGFARDTEGHHKFTLPRHLPMSPPQNGRGIAFIDEVGTGTPMDQNRVSTLLTAGYQLGYYGHKVAPGWYWVAATNPDEAEYHLNAQLDARVRDRFMVVYYKPNTDDIVHHLNSTNKIPELLGKFFRMNNEAFACATPRKWEQIGMLFSRWLRMRTLSLESFANALRLELPGITIDKLVSFIRLGENPDEFPLSAKQVMAADADTLKIFNTRVTSWAKRGRNDLLAATCYDFTSNLADASIQIDDLAMKKLLVVAEQFSMADLLKSMLERMTTARKQMVSTMLAGNASHPIVKQLAEMTLAARPHNRKN